MLIQTYTAAWVKDFANIKSEIEKGLHGPDHTIEHIGSTAVPGLDSKPIIDIDIIYSSQPDFEKIRSTLITMGYDHHGNQGIEDREVFKRNGRLIHDILDTVKHHLYVCPIDSKALERHILCRDHLMKNDWARIKYQQMKYELAERASQDRKVYAALKELHINTFIDEMIKAEKQARCHVNHSRDLPR